LKDPRHSLLATPFTRLSEFVQGTFELMLDLGCFHTLPQDQRQTYADHVSAVAEHAFIWGGGIMTDLNALVPTDSGWLLTRATGINNGGRLSDTVNGTASNVLSF
jgi:hypothetical protein